jgi:hypothetical protein
LVFELLECPTRCKKTVWVCKMIVYDGYKVLDVTSALDDCMSAVQLRTIGVAELSEAATCKQPTLHESDA